MMNRLRKSDEDMLLDFFVGEWQIKGRLLPDSASPGGPSDGSVTYRWDVGDKWLLYVSRQDFPGLGMYEVHGGVAFNVQNGKYDAYAVNSIGYLLVYEGEWSDEDTLVLDLVYPEAIGGARIVYRKLADGSISMSSENQTEEGGFRAYFEAVLTRATD